ncbi:hypothetical protein ASPACDRAFT_111277 [Aspergillus aculeatus ATCC 16872]|uniref:Zn(2)-C6 fungal-type domain-containing protein n=1 Tax=Aspergillus aculeatus (strain ATCC 16872 / CBS 172.66 / WB 5094) TaxID=690307 RepID=A0A1L9X4W0_ASPA1|nr:uncharacterized protein ASPACDRAFT_111277 [Aspergillus aculeatus ATCC 16872]OJK03485.1 hypothetical protein ASPACDRAFT_111277 [Aspergillus aculeatus ATCC 16872]
MEPRRRTAPYGRACLNCARAKCKCLLRTTGGGCERCIRLKKECIPAPTVRQRRPRASRTARLEQKLDGLVSLLQTGNALGESGGGRPKCLTVDSDRSEAPANTVPPQNPYALPAGVEFAPAEAEANWEVLRTRYLPLLPLVHFDHTLTARTLRQERPFFWTCAMAVTCSDGARQEVLGRAVREMAAREVVVEGRRTVDLLLGLLCLIGWGHFRFAMGPLLTVFSHLSTALTLDLELQRREVRGVSYLQHLAVPLQFQGKIRVPDARTQEHRRMVVACFLLTSSAATFHGRVESLSWSPYLEECLTVLKDINEAPGDALLVGLVKLQLIAAKVTRVWAQSGDCKTDEGTRMIGPFVASLNMELAAVRDQAPAHLKTNRIFQTMASHAEITINELALLRTSTVPIATDTDLQTLNHLFQCVEAIKSWIRTILQFDAAEYIGFPFPLWKQFRTVVLVTLRLGTLDDPAWDTGLVRRSVDLPGVLDEIAGKLERGRSQTEEPVFATFIKMVHMLKSWTWSVYADGPSEQASSGSPSGIVSEGEQAAMENQPWVDFVCDDEFWNVEFLGWPYLS